MFKRSTTIENMKLKEWDRNGPDGSGTATSVPLVIPDACMFDSGTPDYMSRTPGSASNCRTWTFSTWVKRGKIGVNQSLFTAYLNSTNFFQSHLQANDTFDFYNYAGGVVVWNLTTTQVFRDVGAWYHFLIEMDTTQATAANRVKLYINGMQVTAFSATNYPTLNYESFVNSPKVHHLGRLAATSLYLNGYLSDTYLIDGTALTPSSFGKLDANNTWIPKAYNGAYGTNGFYLDFADAANLGNDANGSNNYTTSGMTTANQVSDTPTNNYCVLNPLDIFTVGTSVITEGNLKVVLGTSNGIALGSFGASAGKWYIEVDVVSISFSDNRIGVCKLDTVRTTHPSNTANGYAYKSDGNKVSGGSAVAYGSAYTNGDIIGIALDMDTGDIEFYKNNVSQGVAYTGLSGDFTLSLEDGNGSGAKTYTANFGQRAFTYTPPTGFKALSTANLSDPAILDPRAQFDVDTYEGTGAELARTALDFEPDLVWIKNRDATDDHKLTDSVRGATKSFESNTSAVEVTEAQGLKSFDTDGFTLGTDVSYNTSAEKYVAWCWKEGALPGFDMVSYAGNGVNRTIAHNLGVVPEMMIVKGRSIASGWMIYHKDLTSAAYILALNLTNVETILASAWNSTDPTSAMFSIGDAGSTNANGFTYINCLFAGIEGFSKFGSYEGNGNANGTFVWCGFRPAFVMCKSIDSTSDWYTYDNQREGYNVDNDHLLSNSSAVESTANEIDLLSNGFKLRIATDPNVAETYIFMAFAEAPFKTARAR